MYNKKDLRYRLPETASPIDTIEGYSPFSADERPSRRPATEPRTVPQLRSTFPAIPTTALRTNANNQSNITSHSAMSQLTSDQRSLVQTGVHLPVEHYTPYRSTRAPQRVTMDQNSLLESSSPTSHRVPQHTDPYEEIYSPHTLNTKSFPLQTSKGYTTEIDIYDEGDSDAEADQHQNGPQTESNSSPISGIGKRLVRKLVRVKRRGRKGGPSPQSRQITQTEKSDSEELKVFGQAAASDEASPTSTTRLVSQPQFLSPNVSPRKYQEGRPPSGRKFLTSSLKATPNADPINSNNTSQNISSGHHTPNSFSLDQNTIASGDNWALRQRTFNKPPTVSALKTSQRSVHLSAENIHTVPSNPPTIMGSSQASSSNPTPRDAPLPSMSAPGSLLQRPASSRYLLPVPRGTSNLGSMLGSSNRGSFRSPSDRWQQLSSGHSSGGEANRIRRGRILRGVAIPNAKPVRLSNYSSEDSSLVDTSSDESYNNERRSHIKSPMSDDLSSASRRPTTVEEGLKITVQQTDNNKSRERDAPPPATLKGKVIKFFKDYTKTPRHVKCFKDPKIKERDVRKGFRQAIKHGLKTAIRPKKLYEEIRELCASSTSLFIFGRTNKVRCFMWHIVHSRVFELFIILHIFANSISLATQDPSQTRATDNPADVYFTIVFFIEMVLRVIGEGFILHAGAYMRNGWNVLDFSIVLVSFLNLLPGMADLSALRPIRVLRPLRSMTAISGLRVMVIGLARSLMGLMNVLTLLLFIYSVFGVGGVILWKGTYRMHCARSENAFVDWDNYIRSLATEANQTDIINPNTTTDVETATWELASFITSLANTSDLSTKLNITREEGTLPPGAFYAPIDEEAAGSYCRPGNEPGSSGFGYGCPSDMCVRILEMSTRIS